MKVRAVFCGMIVLLAVAGVLSPAYPSNEAFSASTTGITPIHTHRTASTTLTTTAYVSYPYPYPYPIPYPYPYVTTQTVTYYSVWTETDFTTWTITSVPNPVVTTSTFTSVTTDTTVETLLGGLTTLFAALFLAASLLLTRTRHRPQPTETKSVQQAIMRPSYVCDACGSEVEQTSKYCVKCGAQLRKE